MKIFTLLMITVSQLLLEHISETPKNAEKSSKLLGRYFCSEFSLLEGLCAIEMPLIHNLRFFGPFTKRQFRKPKEDGWYISYHAQDGGSCDDIKKIEQDPHNSLSFVACKLFPSVGATEINIYTQDRPTFAKILSKSKAGPVQSDIDKSIDEKRKNYLMFLAGLLFCCNKRSEGITGIVVEKEYGMQLNIFNSKKNMKYIDLYYQVDSIDNKRVDIDLITVLNVLLNIDNTKLENIMINSRVLIKSFIVHYLETRDEAIQLTEYLENNLIQFFGLNLKTLDNCANMSSQINSILDVIHIDTKFAPCMAKASFSFLNPYCSKNNRESYSKQDSSTCTKNAIYHLLNFLLWNSHTKSYTTVYESSDGEEKESPISMIFKGELKGAPRDGEMTEWHKLLENIPNSELREQLSTSPNNPTDKNQHMENSLQKVCYWSSEDKIINELNIGLIETLKVIEYVTGRGNKYTKKIETLLKGFNWGTNNIVEDIEGAIEDMLKDILNQDEDTIELNVSLTCPYIKKTQNGKECPSYEICCTLNLSKEYKNFQKFNFKLNAKGDHEKRNKVRPSLNKGQLRNIERNAEVLKNSMQTAEESLQNLLKMIYFRYLKTLGIKDKLKIALIENLKPAAHEVGSTKQSNLEKEKQMFLKRGYKYLYELLFITKLDASEETALFLSDVFKDILEYTEQFKEKFRNYDLEPNFTEKIISLLTHMTSNLFKSIDMYENGTFSIFQELQKNNLKVFYNLDCLRYKFFRRAAFEKFYDIENITEEYIERNLKQYRDMPIENIQDRLEIISKFLYEAFISNNGLINRSLRNLFELLRRFHSCYAFLNFSNIDLGANFILKFPILYELLTLEEKFLTSPDLQLSNDRFYISLIEKIQSRELRKKIIAALFTYAPRNGNLEMFNTINHLLLNKDRGLLELLQRPSGSIKYHLSNFLAYKLIKNVENFTEVVEHLENMIISEIDIGFCPNISEVGLDFEHIIKEENDFPRLQIFITALNKMNRIMKRITVVDVLESLSNYLSLAFKKDLETIELLSSKSTHWLDNPYTLIIDQRFYANFYFILEGILINITKLFEKIGEDISIVNYYRDSIQPYKPKLQNYYEIKTLLPGAKLDKKYHINNEFDLEELKKRIGGFMDICKRLKNFLSEKLNI